MIGDTTLNQIDTELIAWIDSVPLSKPTKNLTKDFSDAGNSVNIHSISLGSVFFLYFILFYRQVKSHITDSSYSGNVEIVLSAARRAAQLRAGEQFEHENRKLEHIKS